MLIDTFTVNGRNVYVYGKEKILSSSQVPMILDLNCTTVYFHQLDTSAHTLRSPLLRIHILSM